MKKIKLAAAAFLLLFGTASAQTITSNGGQTISTTSAFYVNGSGEINFANTAWTLGGALNRIPNTSYFNDIDSTTATVGAFTGAVYASDGSAASPSISFTNDTNSGFYSANTNTAVGMAANGSMVMILDGTTGFVGIGTLSPSTKLEVDGTTMTDSIKLGTGATVDTIETMLTNDVKNIPTSSAVTAAIEWEESSGILAPKNGADDVAIDTDTFFADVSVKKVGIGTDTPLAKLHVAGTAFSLAESGIAFGDGDSGFYEGSDDALYVSTGGSSVAVFQSTAFQSKSHWPLSSKTYDLGSTSRYWQNSYTEFLNLNSDLDGTYTTPSLAFGDGDSGFFENTDDSIHLSLDGSTRVRFYTGNMDYPATGGFNILFGAGSSTSPIFRFEDDENTGIGRAADDQLSLIAGGSEILRLVEDSTNYVEIRENNIWLGQTDNAGTGIVNLIRANSSDEIDLGAPINIGDIALDEDAGAVTVVDMSVSATPSAATEESYSMAIDGEGILKIYAEADGSGGIQNEAVVVSSDLGILTGSTTDSGVHFGEIADEGAYLNSNSDNNLGIFGGAELVSSAWTARSTEASGVNLESGIIQFFTDSSLSDGSTFTPSERMRIGTDGFVGVGTVSPSTELEVDGTVTATTFIGNIEVGLTTFDPSTDQARADDSTITIDNTIVRVVGDSGAAVLDTDPAIEDGANDGQVIIIQGTDDTNTVQIVDAVNTALAGATAFTFGQGDTMQLIWDSGDSIWYEVSRSDN